MKFRLPALLPEPAPIVEDEEGKRSAIDEKVPGHDEKSSIKDQDITIDDHPEYQNGVKSVEASNQVWSKTHLILAYIL
jgi:hypothetical protein